MADVDNWYYSDKVKDHFFNPKNFASAEPKAGDFDGVAKWAVLPAGIL